jgi:hypothetical protein
LFVPEVHTTVWNMACSARLKPFEECAVGLFEPDILNDAPRKQGRYAGPPERRLMVAILEDAVDCLRKNAVTGSRRRRRLFTEAEEWMRSDDTSWIFSFRNICDLLGLDTQALRAQAAAWKRDQPESVGHDSTLGIAS